jgi:hypothetical protein
MLSRALCSSRYSRCGRANARLLPSNKHVQDWEREILENRTTDDFVPASVRPKKRPRSPEHPPPRAVPRPTHMPGLLPTGPSLIEYADVPTLPVDSTPPVLGPRIRELANCDVQDSGTIANRVASLAHVVAERYGISSAAVHNIVSSGSAAQFGLGKNPTLPAEAAERLSSEEEEEEEDDDDDLPRVSSSSRSKAAPSARSVTDDDVVTLDEGVTVQDYMAPVAAKRSRPRPACCSKCCAFGQTQPVPPLPECSLVCFSHTGALSARETLFGVYVNARDSQFFVPRVRFSDAT